MTEQSELTSASAMTSLPPGWQRWYARICELLEISVESHLEDQKLSDPWFLFPRVTELEEEEADELIGEVRRHFDEGQNTTVRSVKSKLRKLGPRAMLVFLYVMRYIAFRNAERHSYWPAFRESLFEGLLTYDEVAGRLAPATSELWIRLYELTQGALFYPREGLRHIKWPLSHAGFLSDDKKLLKEFAETILGSGEATYIGVVQLEVDEFILNLLDWLDTHRDWRNSRIGHLMSSKLDEKEIVAELAQQWLEINMDELRDQRKGSSAPLIPGSPVRRRIRYDPRRNTFALVITLSKLAGSNLPTIDWQGARHPIPVQYDPSSDVTLPLDFLIPLSSAAWANQTSYQIADRTVSINIPTFPETRSLVFSATTGLYTKRWELGNDYYVLVPSGRYDPRKLSDVFTEWFVLENPSGEWTDYSFLWAHTVDPFGKALGAEVSDRVDAFENLEQVAEDLALPSFGHQFHVRPALVGGQLADHVVAGEDNLFLSSRPPYLEIRGLWSETLEISLQRREGASGDFVQVDVLEVDKQLSGTNKIIEAWEFHATPGFYQFAVGDQLVDFEIAERQSVEADQPEQTAAVKLELVDESGHRSVSRSRHAWPDLRLWIEAWPHAELSLEIGGARGGAGIRLPMTLNIDGFIEQTLAGLPVSVDKLPKGDLVIKVSGAASLRRQFS